MLCACNLNLCILILFHRASSARRAVVAAMNGPITSFLAVYHPVGKLHIWKSHCAPSVLNLWQQIRLMDIETVRSGLVWAGILQAG